MRKPEIAFGAFALAIIGILYYSLIDMQHRIIASTRSIEELKQILAAQEGRTNDLVSRIIRDIDQLKIYTREIPDRVEAQRRAGSQ